MSRVIALGFFDGVHTGHAKLLERAAIIAKETNAIPTALTFDGHPEQCITGNAQRLITNMTDRAEIMKELYGIQEVIVLKFDEWLMHINWKNFIQDILIHDCKASHVVAGHDFHFGYKGEGNPALLQQVCAKNNVGCDIIQKIELDGITISSTYIRRLIAQGEMELAEKFLGRHYSLSGIVTHGQGLASTWGVPTINIPIENGLQHMAYGVYFTHCIIDKKVYNGLTNVGIRPTVCNSEAFHKAVVETSIFDFSQDIYGKFVTIKFLKFLRPEKKFGNFEELSAQINKDILQAKSFHSSKI